MHDFTSPSRRRKKNAKIAQELAASQLSSNEVLTPVQISAQPPDEVVSTYVDKVDDSPTNDIIKESSNIVPEVYCTVCIPFSSTQPNEKPRRRKHGRTKRNINNAATLPILIDGTDSVESRQLPEDTSSQPSGLSQLPMVQDIGNSVSAPHPYISAVAKISESEVCKASNQEREVSFLKYLEDYAVSQAVDISSYLHIQQDAAGLSTEELCARITQIYSKCNNYTSQRSHVVVLEDCQLDAELQSFLFRQSTCKSVRFLFINPVPPSATNINVNTLTTVAPLVKTSTDEINVGLLSWISRCCTIWIANSRVQLWTLKQRFSKWLPLRTFQTALRPVITEGFYAAFGLYEWMKKWLLFESTASSNIARIKSAALSVDDNPKSHTVTNSEQRVKMVFTNRLQYEQFLCSEIRNDFSCVLVLLANPTSIITADQTSAHPDSKIQNSTSKLEVSANDAFSFSLLLKWICAS